MDVETKSNYKVMSNDEETKTVVTSSNEKKYIICKTQSFSIFFLLFF